MDDISVDVEKSRKEGYQNIISNRGARAARAHERKTNEKNYRNEIEGTGSDVGSGELEAKNILPLGPVPEGSRARRRRENKEKKERELELYGVDGKFPVRLREGKRIEKRLNAENIQNVVESNGEVKSELKEIEEGKLL